MSKIIKLTESDLKIVVKKILKEENMLGDISNFVLDKVIDLIKKIDSESVGDDEKSYLKDKLNDLLKSNDIEEKDIESLEKEKESPKTVKKSKFSDYNIIIGDSQVPYIDKNTSKASVISKTPGKESLWSSGKTVAWLIEALRAFPVTPEIENVIISIGTNGGFGKYLDDDLMELFKQLRKKFPNADYYVVQGSWGWGKLKGIEEKDVRKYYKMYQKLGARLIEPPIGEIEPHRNHPVYTKIGSNIDKYL